MGRQVALVTGASRGIGKACAVELAAAGFDVALTARTVLEGEQREHSPTVKASDKSSLPGSLQGTAAMVMEAGAEAMIVPADLLDRASVSAAVATVLERKGRVDVVVNNGRYVGPGHMDRFTDTPLELLEQQIHANVVAPLLISQLVLPGMIAAGGGTIINVTSSAGRTDPPRPAGEGGWGMGYGLSKGALQRVAGVLALELGSKGIRSFNVEPGPIATERKAQDYVKLGLTDGAPPAVMGKVVRWLCTEPAASALNGTTIEAQGFCHERGLLPSWDGPFRRRSIALPVTRHA